MSQSDLGENPLRDREGVHGEAPVVPMVKVQGTSAQGASTEPILTRKNLGKQSTGPRTAGGKERSKYNATKHGLFSSVAVMKGEPREQYESLLNFLRDSLQPEGMLEEILVEKLATYLWRHRRLLALEATDIQKNTELTGAELLRSNMCNSLGVDHLVRYEAILERGFERTLNQLERLQHMRLGHPVAPHLDVNIST